MKNQINKSIFLKALIIVTSLMLPFLAQAASLVNLGTLDVRPTAGGQSFNLNLNPGQKTQQQIQISNFSDQTMKLQIYVADATESNQQFIANDQNQLSNDLYPWVNLPTNKLELAAGQSKILSVNISTPNNAGVGMHTGAIMVSQEINGDQNTISIEKGVRIYANIKGLPAPNLNITNSELSESGRFLNYSNTISNAGNTDLKGDFTLNLYDQSNQLIGSQRQAAYLKPQTSQPLYLSVEKPAFGIFHTTLSNNLLNQTASSDLGWKLFLPDFAIPLVSLLILGLIALAIFKRKIALPKLQIPQLYLNTFIHELAFKKIATFFSLLVVVTIVGFNISNFSDTSIRADLLGSSKSYLTTIKWGNLNKKVLPATLRTDWQGSIKFENATISIQDYLDQEKTDQFWLNSDQNILFFKNTTGPDNDGVNLIVTPTSDKAITATYRNNLTSEELAFSLDSTIKLSKSFNFKAHQISFTSTTSNQVAKIETITENPATEEISNAQSSGEVTTTSLQDPELSNQLKVLQQIISDLPSSGETLSDYVLNSNYVQEVSSENQTTTITADPSLISALQDTPETISEITSTEELNFLFIPNQKIRFSPQSFSFNERKTVTQDLGKIIFVQNRNSDWNTYLGITDLVSISGKGDISVSNITVDPGKISILSGETSSSNIQAGSVKKLGNEHDGALLANIHPITSDQIVFSIEPKITISVPPNTLPGTYRGQITIKAL